MNIILNSIDLDIDIDFKNLFLKIRSIKLVK